jgi:hypothetical protein
MLLYLAIALVAAGVLIVLVSAAANRVMPASVPPERDIQRSRDIGVAAYPDQPVVVSDEPASEHLAVEQSVAQADPEGVYTGSLYEDRNSVITPGDPMPVDYAGIGKFAAVRRIASGRIFLTDISVDIREAGRLHRYNYNRISRVVTAGESALIYPDSLAYPLVILTDNPAFSADLAERFNTKKG